MPELSQLRNKLEIIFEKMYISDVHLRVTYEKVVFPFAYIRVRYVYCVKDA